MYPSPVTDKEAPVEWKLEVVTIPVSDMDRARSFYADQMGFKVDIDQKVSEDLRFLQLTPPGSGCSLHFADRSDRMKPGSLEGLFLVVSDVRAARAELMERGVVAEEVLVFDSGDYRPPREGESLDLVGIFYFNDPDGNRWTVQQIPPRG